MFLEIFLSAEKEGHHETAIPGAEGVPGHCDRLKRLSYLAKRRKELLRPKRHREWLNQVPGIHPTLPE